MKRFLIPLVFIILLAISVLFAYLWWSSNSKPVSSDQSSVSFVVPKGFTAGQVAQKLYEKKLVKSPLSFKFYVQFLGKQGNINAGEFQLSPSMSLKEIIKTLQGGPLELWVTIPEGLRREQISEIFIKSLGKLDNDGKRFRQEFLNLTEVKEGYLFPDTYLFPPDVEAAQVVDKLLQTFESKTAGLKEPILKSGYSLDQVVTMASIIERETKTDSERPIVAGILWKRIETDGWMLQADATVQYVVGNANCKLRIANCENWWPVLSKSDLKIDSLYNSYLYGGLPPTPISNSGLSSIEAAVHPEENAYWFYVHDSEGQIHYAKSLSEHNENISKYLGK